MKAKGKNSHAGYTLVEMIVVSALSGIVFIMGLAGFQISYRMQKRISAQILIQSEGRIAYEGILKALREEFVNFYLYNDELVDMGLPGGICFTTDTDHDGAIDGVKGWYLRNVADTNSAEKAEWELVEVVGNTWPPTELNESKVLCRHIVAPWTSRDGTYQFDPFNLSGNDPALDVGLDGTPKTEDQGESDGIINEIEIGNYYNGNGVIDHPAEVAKITAIGIGLKFSKSSIVYEGKSEDVVIFEGTVTPRNWAKEEEAEEED